MTRNRLLLHIGTHKTGTTTLQTMMAQQREDLAKQGFWYARTDREPWPHNNKHLFFGRTLTAGGEAFAALHASMLEEFAQTGCHTLVLSEEGLAGPVVSRNLAPIMLFAKDFDVEVVCYLRRQDYFAESFWNQGCKTGNETLSISDYVQKPHVQRYMRYGDMLGRWAGVGKVTALGYEAARDLGIVESFAKVTGMPLVAGERTKNVSPSMTLAAAFAVLTRLGKAPSRWQDLEPLLGQDLRHHALGSRLRAEILARYAEHNAKLLEEYGVRFPDSMPEEPEDPIAEPTVEEARRLFRLLRGSRPNAGLRRPNRRAERIKKDKP